MPTGRLFSVFAFACVAAACSSTKSDPASGDGDEAFTSAENVAPPEQTFQRVTAVGHSDAARVPTRKGPSAEILGRIQEQMEDLTERPLGGSGAPGLDAPAPKASVRGPQDRGLLAFPALGITDVDKAFGAPTGITPPDQALCAGNGFVLEAVNSALQIYDILGAPVGGPINPGPFFNFPPDVGTKISFASDPKCYFDPPTGRFFTTILRIPYDLATNKIGGSFLDIAVSQTGDPRGAWNVYEVDLTDAGENGTPNHPHCPCLGDQPLIGADANGFYVSTNEFGLDEDQPGFNGAQIYAFSKKALVSGSLGTVTHLANLVLANGIGFSIQPAFSPSGNGSPDAHGTAFFLSALDFDGTLDNRIALWSLSNTASLDDAAPSVKLEHTVLASETYGMAPPASQKAGPTPLKDCLAAGNCPASLGLGTGKVDNTLQKLSSNDDRMNQTVYAAGRIWGAVNTVVQMTSAQRSGIAYFSVEPRRLKSGRLGGRMRAQGYVALDDADLMYPSIALTDDGRGAIAFAMSGENDYPSAAYVRIRGINKGPGPVHIAGAGAGPLDDSSGYSMKPGQPQGPSRFGDYSAALIDGSTLWMSTEAVTAACPTLDCPARDAFTNWGTVVSRIDLDDPADK
jgi:hypothetical protein